MWSVIFYYFTITVNNLFSKLYLIKEKWTIMEFRFNKLDLIFKLRKFLSENLSREKMNRLDVLEDVWYNLWKFQLKSNTWKWLIYCNFFFLRKSWNWFQFLKIMNWPYKWIPFPLNLLTKGIGPWPMIPEYTESCNCLISYMRSYDTGQSMSSNGRVLFLKCLVNLFLPRFLAYRSLRNTASGVVK